MPCFRVEAESLRRELNANLNLKWAKCAWLLNVYDLFGFRRNCSKRPATRFRRSGDRQRDRCATSRAANISPWSILPGQFDQRAASAVDWCG